MLANFLIGLREGLEASLIVSILIAYLVKSNRRHEIRYVWTGVGAALVLVVAVFSAITAVFDQLSFKTQEIVGGTMSILAADPGHLDDLLDASYGAFPQERARGCRCRTRWGRSRSPSSPS